MMTVARSTLQSWAAHASPRVNRRQDSRSGSPAGFLPAEHEEAAPFHRGFLEHIRGQRPHAAIHEVEDAKAAQDEVILARQQDSRGVAAIGESAQRAPLRLEVGHRFEQPAQHDAVGPADHIEVIHRHHQPPGGFLPVERAFEQGHAHTHKVPRPGDAPGFRPAPCPAHPPRRPGRPAARTRPGASSSPAAGPLARPAAAVRWTCWQACRAARGTQTAGWRWFRARSSRPPRRKPPSPAKPRAGRMFSRARKVGSNLRKVKTAPASSAASAFLSKQRNPEGGVTRRPDFPSQITSGDSCVPPLRTVCYAAPTTLAPTR